MPINYYCAIAMNGSDIEMNKNQLQLPVIDNESTAPSSPVRGQMYYNNDAAEEMMYFFNGSNWIEMDGTGSGVTSFKATDGTYIDYSPNTATTGAITLTGDLSASGLTGDGSTQFLRGDNTWATPAGAYTSWELSGDTGTPVDITDGLKVDFTGGIGIDTTVASATPNTLTIDLDVNKLTSATPVKTDFLAFSDEDQTGDPTRKAKIETILALGGFISSAGAGLVKSGSSIAVYYSSTGIINDANDGTGVTLADLDEFLFEDANGTASTAVMRGTLSQLKTYIGADNYGSWTLAGDTGDNQTISSTNTATFEGYAQDNAKAGITTNGLNTDKLQIGLDQSKIVSVSTAGATDYVLISDATNDANERIPIRDLHLNQFGDAEGTIDMGGNKILDVADPTLAQDAATKAYVDGLVTGGLQFKGTFNAATGLIASGDNSGSYLYQVTGAGAFDPNDPRVKVEVGDYYVVATAGNFYGNGGTGSCSTTQLLDIGDSVIGVLDAAVNTSNCADWSIVQSDEGVTDFSANFGTFVSGTDKSSAVGSVDVGTIDLVDNGAGGSPSSTTFYAGDGNWRTPANTQNPFQTISGSGTDNTDSGIALSNSGGTVLVLGAGSVTAAQSGNTITLTGTNTTYTAGVGLSLSGTEFNVNVGATGTTQAPQSITTTSNRLYQVETDDQDNLVVNVPWSDTNTNLVTSVDEDTTAAYKGIRVDPTTGDVKVGLDINGLTLVTPAGGDLIPVYDVSGTPENKKATVTSLAPMIRKASTYAGTITGFGTVTHDLGSYDVIVQLYNATSYETIHACVDRTSVNEVGISGNSFPSGNIRVLVSLADAGA